MKGHRPGCPFGMSRVQLAGGAGQSRPGQVDGIVDRLVWSDDARHRLDRVPPYAVLSCVIWWKVLPGPGNSAYYLRFDRPSSNRGCGVVGS